MNKSVKFIMSTMLAGIMVTNMYGNVVLAEENDGDDTVIIIDGETDNDQDQDQIPEEFPEQNLDDGDEGETFVEPDPAESDNIERFVSRLYTTALGRPCDEEGLANWSAAIKASDYSINEVARLFITGEEFLSHNYSNEEYVKILYNTFFDREPDKAGIESWIKALEDGTSRNAVLSGFTDSVEWKALCSSYGIKDPEVVIDGGLNYANKFVDRFYLCFLGRAADSQGRESWVKLITSGEFSACDVALGFVYSQEFMNSDHSTQEFVNVMYNAFLGRDADAEGLKSWGYLYEHGLSPRYFVSGFAHSDEFNNICKRYNIRVGDVELVESRDKLPLATCMVYDLYSCLDRPVTATELNTCADMLLKREGMNTIVNMVLLSDEYVALNKSDEDFAKDVYMCVLGRSASETDVNGIVSALAQGTTRKTVIENITSSTEFKLRCEKANVIDKRRAAPTYLSKQKQDEINRKVYDLQSAFNYAASLRYWRHDVNPLTCSTRELAEEAINRGEGNCYGMAAVFLELARNLGYEGVQVAGQVPSRRGGVTPHSWVELYIDGKTYVCDPDFTYGTGRNGLLIQYGQSGTWRYIREREIKP